MFYMHWQGFMIKRKTNSNFMVIFLRIIVILVFLFNTKITIAKIVVKWRYDNLLEEGNFKIWI